MSIELRDVLALRSQVRSRVVQDQAVVIVQDTAEALVLNQVGTRVVQLVDGERTVAEIIAALREEYEVGDDELEEDLLAYIADLVEARVLTAGPPSDESVR